MVSTVAPTSSLRICFIATSYISNIECYCSSCSELTQVTSTLLLIQLTIALSHWTSSSVKLFNSLNRPKLLPVGFYIYILIYTVINNICVPSCICLILRSLVLSSSCISTFVAKGKLQNSYIPSLIHFTSNFKTLNTSFIFSFFRTAYWKSLTLYSIYNTYMQSLIHFTKRFTTAKYMLE